MPAKQFVITLTADERAIERPGPSHAPVRCCCFGWGLKGAAGGKVGGPSAWHGHGIFRRIH